MIPQPIALLLVLLCLSTTVACTEATYEVTCYGPTGAVLMSRTVQTLPVNRPSITGDPVIHVDKDETWACENGQVRRIQ